MQEKDKIEFVSFKIKQELNKRLEHYCAETRPKLTKGQVITEVLEDFLNFNDECEL